MRELTVLSDGYLGIREYISSVSRPYDLAKKYLPACMSLEAFYRSEGKETYDPAVNAGYREY